MPTELQSLLSMLWLIIPLLVWDGVWRGIALWRAGRSDRLAWFIALLVFNTAGILPIIYIFAFNKKKT